jgi:hypothetical protein
MMRSQGGSRLEMISALNDLPTLRLEPREREYMENVRAAAQAAMDLEDGIRITLDNAGCFSPETLKAMEKDLKAKVNKLDSHKKSCENAPENLSKPAKKILRKNQRYWRDFMRMCEDWLEDELTDLFDTIVSIWRNIVEWVKQFVQFIKYLLKKVIEIVVVLLKLAAFLLVVGIVAYSGVLIGSAICSLFPNQQTNRRNN